MKCPRDNDSTYRQGFATECPLSVDTTARGGNAASLSLQEKE